MTRDEIIGAWSVLALTVFAWLIILGGFARSDFTPNATPYVVSTNSPSTTAWLETQAGLPEGFDPVKLAPKVALKAPLWENGHACGGDLPPCWVMMRESGGDPNAYNPDGCGGAGCYGKWQCDPRTCDGTGSEAEQDAEARRVWDDGRGCQHWNAC